MKIPIIERKNFILRPLKKGDEVSLAEYGNDKEVYRGTLYVPYPYTRKNAREWIAKNLAMQKKKKKTQKNNKTRYLPKTTHRAHIHTKTCTQTHET